MFETWYLPFFLFKGQVRDHVTPAGPPYSNVDHTGLQLVAILLPLSPEFWNYRYELSHLVSSTLKRTIFLFKRIPLFHLRNHQSLGIKKKSQNWEERSFSVSLDVSVTQCHLNISIAICLSIYVKANGEFVPRSRKPHFPMLTNALLIMTVLPSVRQTMNILPQRSLFNMILWGLTSKQGSGMLN